MSATNLEKFTFHDLLSLRKSPKPGATAFYRDAFPWLEAVAAAKGKVDAALDVLDLQVCDEDSAFSRYIYIHHRYWGPRADWKAYGELDAFRNELRKLMTARMDRIRA